MTRRLCTSVTLLGLFLGLNSGCLSLRLFNHEIPETKAWVV